MKIKNADELIKKVNKLKKGDSIDLSLGEDLSIALMNLISIEEHLYFSGMKTNKKKYFNLLNPIRNLRRDLLKEIVKDPKGEEWCISKHLLASSMRLIEVGNKYLAKKQEKKAYDTFKNAFDLYSLFWSINLDLMKSEEIKHSSDAGFKAKFSKIIKKILDCCKE